MKRKRENNSNFILWIISFLLVISLIILGLSIFLKQTPDTTTQYLWSKISGNHIKLQPPADSLLNEIEKKDILIDSLTKKLKKYEKIQIHKKAMVNVESGTLNMRDNPSLSSNIVVRIPDSSFVDILYFDTQYYFLNGNRGRWCKVKYAGKEGWVWDGFIKIPKEQ